MADLELNAEQRALYDAHEKWAESQARIAKRHLPDAFDIEDLMQAARIGLAKAAGRFNGELNNNFKSWAATYVGGEIGMFTRRRNYREATHCELPAVMRSADDATAAKLDGLAGVIIDHQRQAEHHAGQALLHKIAIGLRLIEAKELLEHGQWCAWLESHFRWTPRTAQLHMQLSRNAKRVSHLGLDASLRSALAQCRKPRKGTQQLLFLLVGMLKCEPEPGARPEDLLSAVEQWQVSSRHRRIR